MSKHFSSNWESHDNKIEQLKSDLEKATSRFSNYNQHRWDDIIKLSNEIFKDFKTIRYPTKQERDSAWQIFFHLKNDIYQAKNRQYSEQSSIYKNEIYNKLEFVDYDELGDGLATIFTFGLAETTVEEMKGKGRKLKEIGVYFKSVKHLMTREDKADVYSHMVKIRGHHDSFWSHYKEISQKHYEQRKAEKQRAWEEKREKSQRIKQRIEQNLEKNKRGLSKAQDALDRHNDRRGKLRDDISDAYNDSWRSKAEGWLDELDDKISDIESSIDRYEDWISEDQSKLDNWN